RHPTSTLFPYTTLFRSEPPGPANDLGEVLDVLPGCVEIRRRYVGDGNRGQCHVRRVPGGQVVGDVGEGTGTAAVRDRSTAGGARSEEHTSELQSRRDLV